MKKSDYMSRLNSNLVAKHNFIEICTLALDRHQNASKQIECLLKGQAAPVQVSLGSFSPKKQIKTADEPEQKKPVKKDASLRKEE